MEDKAKILSSLEGLATKAKIDELVRRVILYSAQADTFSRQAAMAEADLVPLKERNASLEAESVKACPIRISDRISVCLPILIL